MLDLSSWQSFVDSLNDAFARDEKPDELAHFLSGKDVTWRGTLVEVRSQPCMRWAAIDLGVAKIALAPSSSTLLSEFNFDLGDSENEKRWKAAKTGDQLNFAAKFAELGGPFPPLSVSTYSTGRSTIYLKFGIASPIDAI